MMPLRVRNVLLGLGIATCVVVELPAALGQEIGSRASSLLEQRISHLIEQLADSNYHRRVNAQWELEGIGLAAFEQLRRAANDHPNPQVERAARYLVESQNVVWWLETDSFDVRELLKNYNGAKAVDRDTLLQQLAELGSDDALLALGRLARFESHELLSKSAAIYLMERIVNRRSEQPSQSETSSADRLPTSIRLVLGDSQRTAAIWLTQLLDELSDPRPAEGVEAWRALVASEHELLVNDVHDLTDQPGSQEAVAVVMRFYRWLGSWITQTRGRDVALELVQPSLSLIGKNAPGIRSAASWALEAKLPELLPELAATYAEEFAEEPQLGYFLAEGYLRMGDESSAALEAEKASASVVRKLDSLRNLRSLNLDEIQANSHYELAQQLASRGLFAWAEQEYLRSLELDLKKNTERIIREDLAQFYWFGGEHAKAAEALRPLAENILASKGDMLPNAPGDYSNPSLTVSNYYFYLGLAAIDRGDVAAAGDYLRKALEADSGDPNPDVVIAMKRIATEEPFRTYFQEQFDKMCDDFRIRVVEAEDFMSRATDRMQRANAAPVLARACNQLAWLLSKCEASPSEAISLSHRSLELWPDEPTFMDTLARCYFSAGQIQEAVRIQTRAVKLAPFERQMALQLEEFKQALEQQQTQASSETEPQ